MKLKKLYERIYNKVFSVSLFKKLLKLPGMEKLLSWEVLSYILFGVLTTVVNMLAYYLINLIPGKGYDTLVMFSVGSFPFLWIYFANAFAWLVSVLFAYITNKLFVFESRSFAAKTVLRELTSFVGARILSFLIFEWGMFALLVNFVFKKPWEISESFVITPDWQAKIVLMVFVVLFNYAVSKLFIFRKKNPPEEAADGAPAPEPDGEEDES